MSVLVDEQYTAVENHVDDVTRQKLVMGQYVDLARLLPKDKVRSEKDVLMELVNRGGRAYYEPAAEHESGTISSFVKWEQAFRCIHQYLLRLSQEK